MPLELGNGRAQSGGAAYFSNSFGQGPAAAQGNAVLVQEFVIQPEYHARLQLFQALSLKLQGSRKVGNGAWRWSLYRVPVFAFEFPVTVVSGYEKVFQCAGVFIELAPVLTGQANVQEAGGGQGHRRMLRQPAGQLLSRGDMTDYNDAFNAVVQLFQPLQKTFEVESIEARVYMKPV